jgi:hypothetical protein
VAAVASGRNGEQGLRLFVVDDSGGEWTELTSGDKPALRIASPDLQRAQRARGRIRDDVSVILDVTVLVTADLRSASSWMSAQDAQETATLYYAGTVDGLAGLIADIFAAGVADGVTLISASTQQDLRALADAALARVARRLPVARAA